MEFSYFNLADIIVLAIVLGCVIYSAKRGLIKTLLGLGYNIIAIAVSRYLYPIVTKAVLETQIYTSIKTAIINKLALNTIIQSQTQKMQADLINSLNIPNIFKVGLLENNNIEIYKLLNVSSIEEYIGGYVATIVINATIFVTVYFLVGFGLKILAKTLNVVSKLPVIKTANKLGGAVLGFAWATIIIWIVIAIIILFFTSNQYAFIIEQINNSKIAIWFYNTDVILNLINKII